MQLHYQGHTLEKTPFPATYRRAIAVNWRYQLPGASCIDTPIPSFHYRQPRAINWRFHTPIED